MQRLLFELFLADEIATALSYSPQFAAFHHIAHAVGHHVLQHYCNFGGVDKVNSR